MNTTTSILNIDNNRLEELETLIGYNFASINSKSSHMSYDELNKFRIGGGSYIHFYDTTTYKKYLLKMTFLGYDCIARNESECHGFNISSIKDEIPFSPIHELTAYTSSVSFRDFILKEISFWSMGYQEVDFPKYNDLIVFELNNGYCIFLVLGDRVDVDVYIQKNTVVDFFNQYPDYEERELILLHKI